jgi:hypothetical protein
MFNRKFAVAVLALALVGICVTPSTQAGSALSNVNQVTFSAPVALPGVILLPGKYVFEAGAIGMNPNIVRVTSADYQKLYFVGLTQHAARPANMPSNQVMALGEAAIGEPAPIRAWYPVGLQTGHEFLYR